DWPVAIRIIATALPITSAGRFWPWGPLGINGPCQLKGHIILKERYCWVLLGKFGDRKFERARYLSRTLI
ncbi:MAG TPA: hypothetical protein VHV26_05470, partial [Rhizomicrobium sp.]|nr:hypothetical protein [Rhizomicrobium sp.]